MGLVIGWKELPIFSQGSGESADPRGCYSTVPAPFAFTPSSSLQEPSTSSSAGGSCHFPLQHETSWAPVGQMRQARLYGVLCSRAPRPGQPLCSDVIGTTRLESGSSAQAGLTNVMELPGFNFPPPPNCLFRSVKSQAHSFFTPLTDDGSSIMIIF